MITLNEAKTILADEYHRDNFLYLFSDIILSDFKKDDRPVIFQNDVFSSVTQLGHSKQCEITIYEVILNKTSQNRRVEITKSMFKVLKNLRVNNAIVSFVNEDYEKYRISLLTSKYEFSETGEIIKTLSNPRRYSYSLGKDAKTKTAYDFLINKPVAKNLNDLTSRFSVEAVNKDFYNKIAKYYLQLTRQNSIARSEATKHSTSSSLQIHGETDQKKHDEFAVRLIGRIMFCWFLKEKKSTAGLPLIPKEILSTEAVKTNYYHGVLEILFFEVLNAEIENRKKEIRNNHLYNQIPYLNGGLFTPLDPEDHYKYSEMTGSGRNGVVSIQDHWFKEFFAVLEQYNFTVDENSSYDIELSIDPEMLGRIFENLLAEINPETGESARKSSGSFYTPREIVDYMVENSLLEYLKEKMIHPCHCEERNNPKEIEKKLKSMLTIGGETDFTDTEKYAIINALYDIKILDPACGSGAFPIGILQKIVYVLQEIDPKAELWFNKITENMPVFYKIEIRKKFNEGSFDYVRKLGVILKSIYGVDKEPIAIEISRLRCFLSLIIDEKVDDYEPNRGIHPLPNLDFKFVIANTLIGLERKKRKKNQETSVLEYTFINELNNIREEYFAPGLDNKHDLKQRFKELKIKMLDNKNEGFSTATYQALLSWDPFETTPANWFDPKWMFGLNDGFDIVIGNPPYVFARNSKSKGITEEYKKYFYKNYTLSEYQINLYPLFIEKGTALLINQGVLCFITPNNWLTLNTNMKLRKFVLNQSKVTILNFYKRVFESADVDAAILHYTKNDSDNRNDKLILAEWETEFILISEVDKEKLLKTKDFVINIEAMKGNETVTLLEKIEDRSVQLSSIAKVKCGLGAYGNGDGIPPQTKEMISNRVYHSINKKGNDWYKYIEGDDVRRYACTWNKKEYLKHGKHLREPRNDWNLFSTPRILVRQIPSPLPYCINACYIEETFLNDRNSMNIVYIIISPLYLLGILNSRLMSYWFAHKFGKLQRGIFPQFKINELAQFPILNISESMQQPIINLVHQVLDIKKDNSSSDISELNAQIDQLVYDLYGLTEDEIKIIEGKQ